jgi:hypothetical protein
MTRSRRLLPWTGVVETCDGFPAPSHRRAGPHPDGRSPRRSLRGRSRRRNGGARAGWRFRDRRPPRHTCRRCKKRTARRFHASAYSGLMVIALVEGVACAFEVFGGLIFEAALHQMYRPWGCRRRARRPRPPPRGRRLPRRFRWSFSLSSRSWLRLLAGSSPSSPGNSEFAWRGASPAVPGAKDLSHAVSARARRIMAERLERNMAFHYAGRGHRTGQAIAFSWISAGISTYRGPVRTSQRAISPVSP